MHYKLLKRVLATFALCLTCLMAAAQHDITGTVKDNTGEPVPGAAIIVAGTTIGTVSDFDGNFALKNVPESASIQASFVGYTPQTLPVGNQTHFDIILKDDSQEIQEVVAVGYGTMKKSDVTGSVASVSTEQLVAKGATGVLENLQGSVPGVSITQSSGRTNGGFAVEIRGNSSLSSDTKPIYVIDGVVCSDMDFLNPQDIERIDVLKDASSTAIYGSRATAGVVMITTKGGASVNKNKNSDCAQKFNVTYDGYYGVTNAVRKMELMDGKQFYNYRFLEFLNPQAGVPNPMYTMAGGLTAGYGQCAIVNELTGESVMKQMVREGRTYDWIDGVTQTGKKQNHYVALSGSTSDISYHFGVGVTDEKGMYDGDSMRKFNFKGSVDSDMNKYLSGGFSLNTAVTKNGYANDDFIKEAYFMNPYLMPYDKDGNIVEQPGQTAALGTQTNNFTSASNPLLLKDLRTSEKLTYRLMGNAYLEVKPMTGLSIKTTYSPSFTKYIDGVFYEQSALDKNHTEQNEAKKTESLSWGWTWTNVVNWNKTFNSDHSVSLMGMNEWGYGNTNKQVTASNGVMDGSLWYNMQSGTYNVEDCSSSFSETSMLSFALRANYSFRGKYMLTGTVRWDGSSKFAEDNRWGSFPSLAAAWRVSEEDFMESTKNVLSNLKLRLSYGVTGNNAGAGAYATEQSVSGPSYQAMGSQTIPTMYPGSIVNKEISWERSNEINVGADFGFLGNRISGAIDLYQKNSKDLLYKVQLPLEAGGGTMTTNIGEVRNRGVEISVTGTIIDNDILRWDMTATFAKNKNEIIEINGSGNDMPSSNLFIGKPINVFRGYEVGGVVTDRMMTVPDNEIARAKGLTPGQKMREYDYYYQCYGWTEGNSIIVDRDGNGTIDDKDYRIYKKDPKWTGSLSTTVSSHGFDFSASAYAKQGQWSSSETYGRYLDYTDRGRVKLMMDYYIPAGTLIDCDGVNADGSYINPKYQEKTHYGDGKTPFPAACKNAGSANTYWKSGGANKYTESSYVKIKNMTLGYTLPKAALEKIHLSKARVYCTVTNPFCWTDYRGWDPEWADASLKNDGPSTMTWEFGLNLKF